MRGNNMFLLKHPFGLLPECPENGHGKGKEAGRMRLIGNRWHFLVLVTGILSGANSLVVISAPLGNFIRDRIWRRWCCFSLPDSGRAFLVGDWCSD